MPIQRIKEPPQEVSVQMMQEAYKEAVAPNGLAKLMKTLRESGAQYRQRRADIEKIFQGKPLWDQRKGATGHITFKHRVTGIVAGFQGHDGAELKPAQVVDLRDAVQNHLNKLRNDFFSSTVKGWPKNLDYVAAAARYEERQN